MRKNKMNTQIISTTDLNSEITTINGMIDNLDSIVEKIDKKLSSISIDNTIYYSQASKKLYDNFIENKIKIKSLHNSLKNFISQTDIIIDKYEELEDTIINETDKIESLNIEV